MPVSREATTYTAGRLIMALIMYAATIFSIFLLFEVYDYAVIAIYVTSITFGSIIVALNEWRIFPRVMRFEVDRYYREIGKKKPKDRQIKVNVDNQPPEFVEIQYDYYIRKTTLSQKLGSVYLISLMSGVLLDITINAVSDPDLFRTIILVGTVALISSIFHAMVLLKHAEYNAGCAIYRNAILGITILRRKYNAQTLSTEYISDEIANVIKKLRCRNEPKDMEECDMAGRKTTELLIMLGYLELI